MVDKQQIKFYNRDEIVNNKHDLLHTFLLARADNDLLPARSCNQADTGPLVFDVIYSTSVYNYKHG